LLLNLNEAPTGSRNAFRWKISRGSEIIYNRIRNYECVPPFTRGVLGHEIGLVVDGELRPLVYDHP
jgi:hypothetical protein